MVNDLESEIWMPVGGYEGLFEVSNKGRVKSLAKWNPTGTNKGYMRNDCILRQFLVDGYCIVNIGRSNIRHSKKVHRLVALAFINNLNSKPQVNHKNGLRTDNSVENLEWCTHGENQKHAYDVLGKVSWLKGLPVGGNPNSKKVLCENFGLVFQTAKSAGEFFGYDSSRISNFCYGNRTAPFGLSFKYI